MTASLGLIVALGGAVWLFAVAASEALAQAWILPAVLTVLGAVALLGGLGWLAARGVRARRHLPPERYRGPSILLLFFLAVAAGNLLSLIPLGAALAAGDDIADPGPLAVTGLLLVTPLVFASVAGLFVLRPRALAGVSFGDGRATARNIGLGIALGAGAWVLAALVGAVIGWLYMAATGDEPVDSQLVADLATRLNPLFALALIGILTPIVEELFFRGIAINAWEREHGTTRAVLGSAVLFGVAHISGGSWLTLPPILLLGLVLGVAYVVTRSLPLVAGMHATFNCLSLAVLFTIGA